MSATWTPIGLEIGGPSEPPAQEAETKAKAEPSWSREVRAIGNVVAELLALPDDERDRVMGYLVDRFGAGYSARKVANEYLEGLKLR